VTPAEKQARFDALRGLGCLCCRMNRYHPDFLACLAPIEIHHLNGGGHHGQKRRGDEFTIPLCSWHHRGVGGPAKAWTALYGPSWAKGSKPFRAVYGSDDELLALANRLIAGGIA
jgi:hypothetical protein